LFLADEPGAECHAITNPSFMLPHVSATFHGRDVFAPAAAHLARRLGMQPGHSEVPRAEREASLPHGQESLRHYTAQGDKLDLVEFGPRVSDPVKFTIPKPERQSDGSWLGHVLYADHFGNLITSITSDVLTPIGNVEILVGPRRIAGIRRTYAEAMPGDLIALVGS
jgi:S-adenosylmethionine hydrolase